MAFAKHAWRKHIYFIYIYSVEYWCKALVEFLFYKILHIFNLLFHQHPNDSLRTQYAQSKLDEKEDSI